MTTQVSLDSPVVIPAVPEKVYDLIWVRELSIDTPHDAPAGGVCRIKIEPMSSVSFDVSVENSFEIYTEELMLAASEVPEVAAALNAVLVAIPPLKSWIDSRQAR